MVQALNDRIDVVENTYLYDKHGNAGKMSECITVDGEVHTIPECMRGYAFFVHKVKNKEGVPAEYPQHRTHNRFTLVVCLKMLIQVGCNTVHMHFPAFCDVSHCLRHA